MEVYDGQKAVNKGDTVKQGDLVVSGVVVSSKGKTILRHASAKIMAEYPEQYQVTIALSEEQKLIAGGAKNYRYLNIGSLRLPLFLAGKSRMSVLNGSTPALLKCLESCSRLR